MLQYFNSTCVAQRFVIFPPLDLQALSILSGKRFTAFLFSWRPSLDCEKIASYWGRKLKREAEEGVIIPCKAMF
jgi:hypothetical protein